jgi:excisionase family DNA binding protein
MPGGQIRNGQPPGRVDERFLSVREAAGVLGCGESTLRRRLATGELQSVRIGHGPCAPVRIAASDLADFLTSSTVGGHD